MKNLGDKATVTEIQFADYVAAGCATREEDIERVAHVLHEITSER